jgi:acyl carrier protein phosphodiesterase
MNYLAHAYFSFGEPHTLVGNLISDFVKGRRQYDYPQAIHYGIRLHRAIDTFTDEHAATRQAKEIFRPHYRLYSGAFVDVVYDHFLANDPAHFADEQALAGFVETTYHHLHQHYHLLPPIFQGMYNRMKVQNWLFNYRHRWGIEKSFGGVVYRSQHLTESATAFRLFEENYAELAQCYQAFEHDLRAFLQQYRQANLPA